MDFFIYDNIMTFNKIKPFNGVNNTRVEINRIEIPENNSFWFFTDMEYVVNNVNLQKRYVHIHKGIGSTNDIRFEKTPLLVTRTNLIYNPKEKRIEIKNSILPWKKPIFMKKCLYHGAKLPSKRMSVIGTWFYDFSSNSIHFIIDYFPQKIKYHWDMEEEMVTFGQRMRVKEL